MTTLPVLYSFRRCPYAIRARLAFAVSAVPVELREVALRSKPAELLSASAKGTVPVLVLPAGAVIAESLDIMLWALRQHDAQAWLQPEHGVPGDMLALIAECDGRFKSHLDRTKYPKRYAHELAGQPIPDLQAFALAHRALASTWLAGLQKRLEGHSGLFGNRTSLADMAVLPFVRQFAHTDPGWFAAQPWPQLQHWLTRFETSALFAAVMQQRAAPWAPATVSL